MRRTLLIGVAVVVISSAYGLAGGVQAQKEDPDEEGLVQVLIGEGSFLGVELAEIDQNVAQRLKLRDERGALVTGVTPGSAAEKAGLQKDDVIVRWNGERVESAIQLQRHVRETPSGRTVRMGLIRNGREMEVSAKLSGRSAQMPRYRVEGGAGSMFRERGRLGIELHGLTRQLAEYFGLSKEFGALVAAVHDDSPAAKAGLKAGDVILSIAGEEVKDPFDVIRIIGGRDEGPVDVKVLRNRQEQAVTVELKGARRRGSSGFLGPDGIAITAPAIVGDLPLMRLKSIGPISVPKFRVTSVAPIVVPRIQFKTVTPIVTPRVEVLRVAPVTVPRINIQPMRLVRPSRRVLI